MKQSSYKGKSPLPDFVIDAACAGNAEAVERVLQHYDGYINKLCILYHSTPSMKIFCWKCQ